MNCLNCGRPIRRTPWGLPTCKPEDREECERIAIALEEPPEPDPPYEDRPSDLDVCGHCKGLGSIPVRQDWETGHMHRVDCHVCLGTGKVPVL
jgi:hypothetical protein